MSSKKIIALQFLKYNHVFQYSTYASLANAQRAYEQAVKKDRWPKDCTPIYTFIVTVGITLDNVYAMLAETGLEDIPSNPSEIAELVNCCLIAGTVTAQGE